MGLTLSDTFTVTPETIDAIQGLGEQYQVTYIELSDMNAPDGTLADTVAIGIQIPEVGGNAELIVALHDGWEVVAQAEAQARYSRYAEIKAIPC